jgi:hypothetical protein
MSTTIAFLLLLAAALPLRAQAGDPLKSAACATALATLQAGRQTAANAHRLEALRSSAAEACLGAAAIPTRPSRVLRPPVVVPPPQIDVPQGGVHAHESVQAPAPPVAIGRPALPATCDAGGCWTSDGTHLRHVPPNGVGPSGLCTQQGGLVYCP